MIRTHSIHSSLLSLGLALGMAMSDTAAAEEPSTRPFEEQVLAADTEMFERGYNECDLSAFEKTISKDFEFYHDQGGITENYTAFMASIDRVICNPERNKVYRRLTPGTSEVFPLHRNGELYGAIHHGDHSFYFRQEDGTEKQDSTAAFTTLWILEKDQWKMRRVLSYDHVLAHKRPPFLYTAYRAKLFDEDENIEALMERMNVPTLALARIRGGVLQQTRVWGELSDGKPAPHDALYKVASLTKPITSVLTLKLVEAGLWDLDEPLSQYHIDPDVADSEHLGKLTTRHVLNHRTGFMNWRYLKEGNTLRFEFEPGTQQQYSGEGMEYLRKSLEAKFGKPMEQLAADHVFGPLGMDDTHFYWTEGMSDAKYAAPRARDGSLVNEAKHTKANAAANLLTTLEDYSRFAIHVMDGAGLSDDLLAQMATPGVVTGGQIPFGLGWEVVKGEEGEPYALLHTGSDPGVKTIVILVPETGDSVVLFTNSDNGIAIYAKAIEEALPKIGTRVVEALINQ